LDKEHPRQPVTRRGPSSLARAIRARPLTTRWLLAGTGALLAALATMAAMPVWLPGGAAGIDNIALPILLTPLLWAIPFFYACLEENLPRGVAVTLIAILAQAALAATAFAGQI
jgi:hypothetical protein